MRRLWAALRCDVVLQARNGFYWAGGAVLLFFLLVVWNLPRVDWSRWMGVLVFSNLVTATFYFMAVLVLLEKSERRATELAELLEDVTILNADAGVA